MDIRSRLAIIIAIFGGTGIFIGSIIIPYLSTRICMFLHTVGFLHMISAEHHSYIIFYSIAGAIAIIYLVVTITFIKYMTTCVLRKGKGGGHP